jgi:hypothetical protein
MRRLLPVLAVVPVVLAALHGVSHAEVPVRTKVIIAGNDPDAEFMIVKYVREKIAATPTTHVLVRFEDPAERVIRVVFSVLTTELDEKPVGVALAVAVTRSPAQGEHDVVRLRARYLDMTDLETGVKEEIARALE